MIQIDLDDLRSLLVQAYENGWRGCLELKDEEAERLIQPYLTEDKTPSISEIAAIDPMMGRFSSDQFTITVGGTPMENVNPSDRATWSFQTFNQNNPG